MNAKTLARQNGLSLLEILAILTILSILVVIILPRVGVSSASKSDVDRDNKVEINAIVERWYFEKGTWPNDDLSDIGADSDYFPDGVPVNPTSGDAYQLDPTTHRVR